MHSNKLVVSLRSAKSQKFYREKNGQVFVPAGDEYELYIKNLSGERAVVTIEIDGKNPHGDTRFVVDPNSTFELKGDQADRAFKFIRKTEKISQFRGDRIDDGLIRISYQFEAPLPEVKKVHYEYDYSWRPDWWYPYPRYRYGLYGGGIALNSAVSKAADSYTLTSTANCSSEKFTAQSVESFSAPSSEGLLRSCNFVTTNSIAQAQSTEESGITTQGNKVEQSFVGVNTRELQKEVHTIILQLMVELPSGKPVPQTLTSRSAQQCKVCGSVSKGAFCPDCGSAIL